MLDGFEILRAERDGDAAVLIGALTATATGWRIFGSDEQRLRDLTGAVARELGPR